MWNNNYNIKPREIARAQEALTDVFQETYASDAGSRDMVRLLMSTVGRGGQGNGGQVRLSPFPTSAVYVPTLFCIASSPYVQGQPASRSLHSHTPP